ncbi:2OG-Fe(II) oxygenase [Vibrio palustris]|uniref:Fe2OG dioxygenase domain-containing protein n=1 Tax=Vibrio palustris TaxID=1918946 RepID=A0A1R4B5E9_9VIBR|nr:2OG-Fe(II) oxygenase [Vibrio palustris]SJL84140.1 hypothetical protein VPAL9027_02121 [Vibrio palustris]
MSLDKLMASIEKQGWFVWDDFLSAEQVTALRQCLPSEWKQAKIGRRDDTHQDVRRRTDKIHWMHPNMGSPVQDYLERMKAIQNMMNQRFFMGLFEYESHFAKYENGDFYEKHYDSFKGSSNRRLTTVFYLNEEWQPSHGGVLNLYNQEEQQISQVEPHAGRLVVFLSEEFPHEVCVSHQLRYSIAGWFRINGVKDGVVDIAH